MSTDEYLTLGEAQSLLGVSKNKMWRLVKIGALEAFPNPLDNRQKLVKRQAVEELQRYAKGPPS